MKLAKIVIVSEFLLHSNFRIFRTIVALGYNISMDKPPARIRSGIIHK